METASLDGLAGSCTAALLTGMAYGLACCGPACGPFLCAYLMGVPTDVRQAAKSLAVFTAARVVTLGGLGFVAAFLGNEFVAGGIAGYDRTFVLRGAIIALGVILCLRPVAGSISDGRARSLPIVGQCEGKVWRFKPATPLWIVGAAFALAPCPPLIAMLACSSQASSPILGAIFMMLFGIGTALSPGVLAILLAGAFSRRIRGCAPEHSTVFQRVSGFILIVLGVALPLH